ncbi:riboflavin kinase/FMN adenylyltransferase [Bifidobacterium actinocoloniiforme DSM 22766]|uniref:Riboflavin kinase/FMN adenylyltransferase n=1 Tax=Bifidobacterium actinocoloniiforme DSM 22766 TaxID=1437605 RepID=A0A086YYT5_9BIFI|nr:riboflavin kinase [Bifidobacterium actinocoloniiforme]AKV55953.1 FAD synthase [Bifidobacterium actinocoloniiforme DSM 22766]KFI39435.1 riboflavin kinase/FMN adenylyltransferase [Bifidobacterium actinocoloniiforme DSM 22766]
MNVSRLEPDTSGIVDWPTLSTRKQSVVSVGVFDGMHRGHRAVIERLVELAHEQGDYAVVIMFDPSPKRVHSYAATHGGAELPDGEPSADPDELMAAGERIRLMRGLGVDWVLSVGYSLAFAAKSYRYFLGSLAGTIGMRTLVLGQDASMGSGRVGDIRAIQELAEATGVFRLEVVDDAGPGLTWTPTCHIPVPQGPGEPADPLEGMNKAERRAWTKAHACKHVRAWSSSNVRSLLDQGRIGAADAVLGRPHVVEGEVVHGEQRGRALGYPTANISPDYSGYMPAEGVYAGWLVDLGPAEEAERDAKAASGDQDQERVAVSSLEARLAPGSPWRWPADISIGSKETFAEDGRTYERVLEVNAIAGDDWLELYGHRVRVEFLAYLRPQEKFADGDALADQLQRDAADSLRLAQEAAARS